MINYNSPTKLFFNINFKNKNKFKFKYNIPPNQIIIIFIKKLQLFINKLIKHNSKKFNTKKILITQYKKLNKPNKHNFHLIYPKIIFKNITQIKTFILSFNHYLFKKKHIISLTFQKKNKNKNLNKTIFNISPYTKNKLFKLIKQNKINKPYKNTLQPIKIQKIYKTNNNFFNNLINNNNISNHTQIITLKYNKLKNINNYIIQPYSFLNINTTPPSTTLKNLIHNSILKNYKNIPLKTYITTKQNKKKITITLLKNNNKTPNNLKSTKNNILPIN